MADYDEVTKGVAARAPEDFARVLAQALAEFTAANNGSARGATPAVAPAVLQARRAAHDEMLERLRQYEDAGTVPRYEITTPAPGGFFVDDILIESGQQIEFYGIPNEQMEPLNQPAREVIALYLASIGGVTPDLADQSYDAYRNRPRQASIVGNRPEPPPLGTPRSQSNVRVVGASDGVPEMPGVTPGSVGGSQSRREPNGRYKSMGA
jgi:hypothetical protein